MRTVGICWSQFVVCEDRLCGSSGPLLRYRCIVVWRTKDGMCWRGIVCCPGLHPSQQLTRYDGEMVPTSTQNGVAQRVSSQASDGSPDDQHTAVSATISDAALRPAEAQAPPQDVSELYTQPSRVIGRRQGESAANDETASYQYGGPYLRESDDRKSCLTGDCSNLSFFLTHFHDYITVVCC